MILKSRMMLCSAKDFSKKAKFSSCSVKGTFIIFVYSFRQILTTHLPKRFIPWTFTNFPDFWPYHLRSIVNVNCEWPLKVGLQTSCRNSIDTLIRTLIGGKACGINVNFGSISSHATQLTFIARPQDPG